MKEEKIISIWRVNSLLSYGLKKIEHIHIIIVPYLLIILYYYHMYSMYCKGLNTFYLTLVNFSFFSPCSEENEVSSFKTV